MSYDAYDHLNHGAAFSSLSVGTSAVEVKVGGSPLTRRKAVVMQPKDNKIYWGYTNSVTTSTGVEMFKDQILILDIGPDISIWVIADAGGKSMRIQEIA